MKTPKEDSALELAGKTQPLRRSYSKDTEPLIFKMGEENLYRKRLIAKGIGEPCRSFATGRRPVKPFIETKMARTRTYHELQYLHQAKEHQEHPLYSLTSTLVYT